MELSDYTVMDLSWLLPGPYGTMLLQDLGMEVVKVERPGEGDYARWLPPEVGDTGLSHLFHTVNRGKKSVVVDLQTDAGVEAFLELAAETDVILEQFRPGVVDRLGIGYDTVRDVNEDIVYVSLSGYGQDGPYRNRVGHDINYAAIAGLLDKTKSRDGEMPAYPGYPIGDMGGGLMAAFAVITGLLQRKTSGEGTYFDVSMTDTILSLATTQEWFGTAKLAGEEIDEAALQPPVEMLHPNHGIYETADGNYVTIAAVEEKFWERLLDLLDREDLTEYHYARGERGEYATRELADEFATRTRSEWEEVLSDEIPFAPVNEFHEVFEHPQVEAREMVTRTSIDGEDVTRLGFPMKTSPPVEETMEPGPALGEHTVAVFQRVLDDETVDRLRAEGVLHGP